MRILIIFYSRYGHTAKLAEAIADGARTVAGAEVLVRRVPEIVGADSIARDVAWAKARSDMAESYPEAQAADLDAANAIIIGTSSYFGNMSGELKAFFDRAASLWYGGKLIGKPGGVFCTTSLGHGGKEATLISLISLLIHHGMIIVGVPASVPEIFMNGSFFGATATTGTGDGGPVEADLAVARALGKRITEITAKLV